MRIFALFFSFLSLGLFLLGVSPAGAVVSSVSGETKVRPIVKVINKIKPSNVLVIKKKIKEVQAEIAKIDLSIKYVQKKLEASKGEGKSIVLFQKKLDNLTKEKQKLEQTLTYLQKKLLETTVSTASNLK